MESPKGHNSQGTVTFEGTVKPSDIFKFLKKNVEPLTVFGKKSKIGLLCGSHGSENGNDALNLENAGSYEDYTRFYMWLGPWVGKKTPQEIKEMSSEEEEECLTVKEMSPGEEAFWTERYRDWLAEPKQTGNGPRMSNMEDLEIVKELRKMLYEKQAKLAVVDMGYFHAKEEEFEDFMKISKFTAIVVSWCCLLYTYPSPRDS